MQARGYLLYNEFYDLYCWKLKRQPRSIQEHSESCIEKVTGKTFCLDNDWDKLEKLTKIYDVGESVASAILHLCDEGDYPILDKHALCSIGINYKNVKYNKKFWKKYVKFCQAEAECHDVSM